MFNLFRRTRTPKHKLGVVRPMPMAHPPVDVFGQTKPIHRAKKLKKHTRRALNKRRRNPPVSIWGNMQLRPIY